MDKFLTFVHLSVETNRTALLLSALYSRALNHWGVEVQRAGLLPEAAAHFELAEDLNPDNVVASINLECNKKLRAGQKIPLRDINAIREQWKYRRWDTALSDNGPFDEPSFCFEQGRDYATKTQPPYYRQAAYHFDRAMTLAPQELEPRLWLAQMHIMTGTPEEAVRLINEVHADSQALGLSVTNQGELLMIEASAHLAIGDLKGAEATVQTAITKYPGHGELLASATQVYLTYGKFTNALETVDQQLKLSPDNADLLANKGYLCIQLKEFERAIAPLTRALELQTNNFSALLNLAIAFLRAERYGEAKRVYERAQKIDPTNFRIYYGLFEIACHEHDTNAAVRYAELYAANSPPPEEAKMVSERLKALKAGKEP
jgi:tetratricopeptide (TPR) repeat protein